MDAHPECDALVFTSGKCLEGMPGMGFAVARMDRAEACAGNAGVLVARPVGRAGECEALRLGIDPLHPAGAGGSQRSTWPSTSTKPRAASPRATLGTRANADALYDGLAALGLRPYLEKQHQGPVIVTVHQPADPRFDLMTFVEALKRRGVLISNFYNTSAPTLRIGAIGAITTDDIRRAVAAIGATLDEVLAKAA